jgi:hypothetical protein
VSFLIFSLPRSGSAWLANFLTYGNTFCWHEPLSEPQPLDELFSRPGSGGVDTLAYTRPDLLSKYQCFVLKRDYGQIVESSRKCGVRYDPPVAQFEAVTRGLSVINYHNFQDISYLESVWCMISGTAFDWDRARLLIELNVQRDLERFRKDRPHFADQIESLRC